MKRAPAKRPRRTLDWARRSRDYFEQHGDPARQMLFGIVQGGTHAALRRENADALVDSGFSRLRNRRTCSGRTARDNLRDDASRSFALACEQPRYLMGVGKPEQTRRLREPGSRHDGLRAAHAQRAPRLPVHFAGTSADQEHALRKRSAADR